MNKPDWKDAPEWAQWLAQDENGNWYWYATKPAEFPRFWGTADAQHRLAQNEATPNPNWRDTLERRPEAVEVVEDWELIARNTAHLLDQANKEKAALIEALRPLANAEACDTDKVRLPVSAQDAARDLLRELGEWPEVALPPVQNNLEAGKPGC